MTSYQLVNPILLAVWIVKAWGIVSFGRPLTEMAFDKTPLSPRTAYWAFFALCVTLSSIALYSCLPPQQAFIKKQAQPLTQPFRPGLSAVPSMLSNRHFRCPISDD